MAVSVRCTGFSVQETGSVVVSFDSGSSQEFNSLAQLEEFANQVDGPQAGDTAIRMLLRHGLELNPDPALLGSMVGKTLTFDMGALAPVQVVAD